MFGLIEKFDQTLETVFHGLSKHLEFRQKYSSARRAQLSSRCLDIPMKHCRSCLLYCVHAPLSAFQMLETGKVPSCVSSKCLVNVGGGGGRERVGGCKTAVFQPY